MGSFTEVSSLDTIFTLSHASEDILPYTAVLKFIPDFSASPSTCQFFLLQRGGTRLISMSRSGSRVNISTNTGYVVVPSSKFGKVFASLSQN